MRASRLLAILILLQLRGRMTAQALAEEFEVSQRTIYRDVDALSAAGVPVYGDKGHGGGFTLDSGYRTRLTGLDAPEIEALMLAGLPGAAKALGIGPQASKARHKLLAALPDDAAASAQRLSSAFHIDLDDWYHLDAQPAHLPRLVRAVLDRVQISFRYQSWRGQRDWRADPLGIVMKGGRWYLLARGVKGTTLFRVDMIADLQLTDCVFERPPGFDLAQQWADHIARFEAGLRPHIAQLICDEATAQRLAQQGRYAAQAVASADVCDAAGRLLIDLPFETDDQLVQLVLGLGEGAELRGPASARRLLATAARSILRNHS